jgi:hypothetical protein
MIVTSARRVAVTMCHYPTVLIEYPTSHRPRVLVEWAATRRQSASRRKGRCDNVTAT